MAIFIVVTVVVRDVLLKMTHCLLANYRARIMSNMFLLSAFVFVNFLSFYFHLLILFITKLLLALTFDT